MKETVWIAFGLIALATPCSASAEDPGDKFFYEGVAAFDRGDYAEARRAFVAASAYISKPAVWRNLAVTEMKLGLPLDALRHLKRVAKVPDLSAGGRATVERDLRAAYDATGHIAVDAPAGSSITVDGNALEEHAPLAEPIDVTVGSHEIVIRHDDEVTGTRVMAVAGAVTRVPFPKEGRPETAERTDRPAALSPVSPPAVSASAAAPPAPPLVEARATPPAQSNEGFWQAPEHRAGVAVIGVGVASLIAGVAFDVAGYSARSDRRQAVGSLPAGACLNGESPACGKQGSDRDSQVAKATAARVLVGVGAAGVVVGSVLALWPKPQRRFALRPSLGPAGGALTAEGEF